MLKGSDIVPPVPKNEAAALNDPVFGEKWRAAKAKELNQFDRFDAYEEVDRTAVPLRNSNITNALHQERKD